MKAPGFTLVAFSALLAASLPSAAATIHVPDDQPTIQAGIDAASYGDTVLVACGTYSEHDIIMESGVCLTSETGLADCVTVDAQQQGRVFYCDGVDNSASIVGLTITGGEVYDVSPTGGGVWCRSSSLSFTNCTFSDNRAIDGGGMTCSESSSPTLTNCMFVSNSVPSSGGGMSCYGSSSPTLTGCTFEDNHAGDFGGGMSCGGSSTLTNCTFRGNDAATYWGGGVLCGGLATFTSCTFEENYAGVSGGGMYCSGGSPTLTNCTFAANYAEEHGGGIASRPSSSPVLTACIIAFSAVGEAVYCDEAGSTPSLYCCDLYGNAGGDWVGCIADQYGANGNFSEDPLFCGDLNPDEPYTLHASSPCSPDSNPECGLLGAWGVGCGLTPVQATSWGAIKVMFQ